MRVRCLKESDIWILKEMFLASGFEYEFPDLHSPEFETVHVVVDDDDAPLMACAAKRSIELYLFCGQMEHPAAKMHGIRLLHGSLSDALRRRGFHEVNAFLPPQIAKRFGGRLIRSFGWLKNWSSFCFRF